MLSIWQMNKNLLVFTLEQYFPKLLEKLVKNTHSAEEQTGKLYFY